MLPRSSGKREVPVVASTSMTIMTATIDRKNGHRQAHMTHPTAMDSHNMVVKTTDRVRATLMLHNGQVAYFAKT